MISTSLLIAARAVRFRYEAEKISRTLEYERYIPPAIMPKMAIAIRVSISVKPFSKKDFRFWILDYRILKSII